VRVFGIDPGSQRTGFGCVETDGRRHRLVTCGAISACAGDSFPRRLARIHRELCARLSECHPEYVVVESLFYATFAFTPTESAFAVQRLIDAGAIPVGKTNLDQFATGLNGTRSPWGACGNAFDPAMVSGGSSAGSAVAVALGLASFSLGTDTAGSGRVPAGFNNLVGLKPSRGLLSNTGMARACREQFGLMADGNGRAEIERTFFDATRVSPDHGGGGDAVVVTGGAILAMSASVVRGSEDAAVMAVGGIGIVDESRFVNNKVGIHLTGTRLRETNERPAEQPAEELVLVKPIFVQTTESRVRTAEITLPGRPVR
jgi:hypothetical protein